MYCQPTWDRLGVEKGFKKIVALIINHFLILSLSVPSRQKNEALSFVRKRAICKSRRPHIRRYPMRVNAFRSLTRSAASCSSDRGRQPRHGSFENKTYYPGVSMATSDAGIRFTSGPNCSSKPLALVADRITARLRLIATA